MTFQQMEYIVAVDKYRHFARAAESCGITQSTLSSLIQKLESELDVTILEDCDLNYEEHKSKPTSAHRCPLLRFFLRAHKKHSSQTKRRIQQNVVNYYKM